MAVLTHLSIDAGLSFRQPLEWGDVSNLSGYTAALQCRDDQGVVLLSLTDQTGIELSVTSPSIVISLTPEQTASLPYGIFSYDLILIQPSGFRLKLIYGKMIVSKTVTEI